MITDQRTEALRIYEQLVSVLCDSEGKCNITGSDADRYIVDVALDRLIALARESAAPQEPVERVTKEMWQQAAESALDLLRIRDDVAAIKEKYTAPCAAKEAEPVAEVIIGGNGHIGILPLGPLEHEQPLYAAPRPRIKVFIVEERQRRGAAPQEPVVACHLHRYSDRIECVYGGEVLPADWRYMPKKYTDLIPLGQSVTFYAVPRPQAARQEPVKEKA